MPANGLVQLPDGAESCDRLQIAARNYRRMLREYYWSQEVDCLAGSRRRLLSSRDTSSRRGDVTCRVVLWCARDANGIEDTTETRSHNMSDADLMPDEGGTQVSRCCSMYDVSAVVDSVGPCRSFAAEIYERTMR